jgi:hypothetical protein
VTTNDRDMPQDPPPATSIRMKIIVAVLIGLAVATAITVAAWPEEICTQSEREALVAVPPFSGVRAPVRESRIEQGAAAPGGCTVEYTVVADGDDVAAYYAERLLQLGWGGLPEFWIDTDRERPNNIWYFRLDGPPNDRPSWEHLHYAVVVKELGSARVFVGVDVTRYVIQSCC